MASISANWEENNRTLRCSAQGGRQGDQRGAVLQQTAIVIVDPQSIFRLGMTTCLEALAIVDEVTGAESVAEAWERPELAQAGLAIVDAAAEGARTFVREVRLTYGVPSLVAGSEWSVEDITAVVEAGAVGVLAKETLTPETLEANVRAALHGTSVLPSELMSRMLAPPDPDADTPAIALNGGQLSAREQQVLSLIAEGHATREVAAKLSYSERTIKNVLHDVATKLGARSRSQAVAHAVRSGLI